ncbi:Myb-like DNA-binding domain-containing protein [Spironucleus salmonicida]|uniref:Myb-like DNA-binding domain-containing protein n=1 Tax=Spironucleus salmonicida TaxID=348837 RepID=V6LHP3_9EUKA|nr:Myb-like DNA-binding domain-containing protein [Spironucleus salmonicida]|eukprot:EST43823.1 Myb-like DNA-binding domain-containing protein [Spironucleus salmonicida]
MEEPQIFLDFIVYTEPGFQNTVKRVVKQDLSCHKRFWTENEHTIINNGLLRYGYRPSVISRSLRYRSTAQVISHLQKVCHRFDKILEKDGVEFDDTKRVMNIDPRKMFTILQKQGLGTGIVSHYIARVFDLTIEKICGIIAEKDSSLSDC